MEKYYRILNLTPGASLEEVKKSFRKLVMQYHPDKNPSPEAKEVFIQIVDAYERIKIHLEKENAKVFSSPTADFDPEAYIKERIRQYIRMKYEEILREEKILSELSMQKLFLPVWASIILMIFGLTVIVDYWIIPLRTYHCELEAINYGFIACHSKIYLTPEDAEKAGQCIQLRKTRIFRLVKKVIFQDGTQGKIANSYDEYMVAPIFLVILNMVALWFPPKKFEGKITLMIFIIVLTLTVTLSLLFLQ